MLKSLVQVMNAYVDSATMGAPSLIRELARMGEASEGQPFSQTEYDANATAGAEYEARQAVRKALSRLKDDRPAEALEVLDAAAKRLPVGPHRVAVTELAVRLRAATAAG